MEHFVGTHLPRIVSYHLRGFTLGHCSPGPNPSFVPIELALQLTPRTFDDDEHYSTGALVDSINIVKFLAPRTRDFKRSLFRACREGVVEGNILNLQQALFFQGFSARERY